MLEFTILDVKGMRIMMLQLSGFYCRSFGLRVYRVLGFWDSGLIIGFKVYRVWVWGLWGSGGEES